MRSLGRRRGGHHTRGLVLLLVVVTGLSGCVPAPPMAFRLGSDGRLDVGSCVDVSEISGARVDLQRYVAPWAYEHDAEADFEEAFASPVSMNEGQFLSFGRGEVETGNLDLSGDKWNRVEVTLVGADFDLVDQVNRDQLVVDEWIWNRDQVAGAVRPCDEPTTAIRTG
ncbi:hypothetical protein ACFQ58_02625 [Agromyces sp. NPDC056523]|uniref:hypothetical protein n=1 Tax=Agromyces sp. NPDC056523 TaxID=3345850 RepID=UPI00366D3467